jgi:ElaB/YqjD/DUF883 family membrane-anchored ribosome-binding protein
MELYYKDLISEDASLDKLVDDLMLVVQGADDLVQAAALNLPARPAAELASRLQRLKANCQRVKKRALTSALATDKLLRRYPYSALGLAFGVGILAATLINRRR